MAGLAVPFEANQGQFAPEVFAGTLFVTRDGTIVHALAGRPEQPKAANQDKDARRNNEGQQDNEAEAVSRTRGERVGNNQTTRGPGWALVESLQGSGALAPTGSLPSGTNVSRFSGAVPNQTSNIATFDRVRLGEPWPGVSVELAARGSNVEKLFTVAPGANPRMIRMRVAGAKRLQLGKDGSLIATTGNGDVQFTPPLAFQDIGGLRTQVPVQYKLLAGNGYRFETGTYNRSKPLVIDPLLQSTYLGGNNYEQASALAVDASGNVFLAGFTSSINFPGTTGGVQAGYGGSTDAFVARLSSSLTTLVQTTYIGGSGNDQASALAIDAGGNVLISGTTYSANFPGTSGGARPTFGGGLDDAFVARLSNSLTTLIQATYLGGSSDDAGLALVRDATGNVFVAGSTKSTNFPGIAGAAQPAIGGGSDAFIARLSGNLATLVQATYLGGSDTAERAEALALDAGGNLLVAGQTNSINFPGTFGGAQPTSAGGLKAFVARLSSSLTTLVQATYLGGSGSAAAFAVALDAGGNVLAAGLTGSSNFPGTSGGAQPLYGGGPYDGFLARLSNNLTTLVQATYLGGSGDDRVGRFALDAGGNVLVAGNTNSTDIPGTSGGAQVDNGGGFEAYFVRLSSSLTTLVQATYLGGSGDDVVVALALDADTNVLVAGATSSSNFPGTPGGAQAVIGANSDAFAAKLTPDLKGAADTIFANGFE